MILAGTYPASYYLVGTTPAPPVVATNFGQACADAYDLDPRFDGAVAVAERMDTAFAIGERWDAGIDLEERADTVVAMSARLYGRNRIGCQDPLPALTWDMTLLTWDSAVAHMDGQPTL